MAYPSAEAVFGDADGKLELAQQLFARVQPIEGTPAEQYLIKTRQLPAAAVGACGDICYLSPPIEGRAPQDHALVALLRDADGEVSGFQLEFCDVLGARTGTEPGKQSYALREHGVRDGLFHAGGRGDVAHVAEGYSCKALAIASLGLKAYGGGAMTVLGFAVPPERTLVLVPDRPPAPDQWTKDGKERLLDLHEAAYSRAVDRLLLAGRTTLIASAPDCTMHAGCKDADGYLRQHGEIRLRDLLGCTVLAELSREGEIKRLAATDSDLDRAAEIKKAWKDKPSLHGIPIGLLREHVEAERAQLGVSTARAPAGPEPWDEPVQLGAVLNELVREIRRYIATPAANVHAAVLWCAMTHVYDRLYCAPKLALQSPTPGAGKTTFLDVLSNVVCRPEPVSGVGSGAFVRLSDEVRPTWLLDEADRLLNSKNAHEGLTGAINAQSYRRLARMQISVPKPDGGWSVKAFEFWCPMLLAGIKRLVNTIQDRSIVLKMQRARPGELHHRLVNGSSPVLRDAQRKLIRWAQDLDQLDLDPVLPRFLHNREADLWRPLFALAREAGGRWPVRVEQAAREIHGQRSEDADRLIELLVAIRECFDETGEGQLATADLVTRLINRADEPWATIKRGQPLDAYYLRTMLGGIVRREKPQQGGGRRVWRGYRRLDFAEAWMRYIPSEPVTPSATSADPLHSAGNPQKEPASGVADEKEVSATYPLREASDPQHGSEEMLGSGSVADGVSDPLHSQHLDQDGEIGPEKPVAHVADHPTGTGTYSPNGSEGPATTTLDCSACGGTFEHGARARGRRPSKCPDCRRGSARESVQKPGCAYCGMGFTHLDEPAEIVGKLYHAVDACAGTIRRRLAKEQEARP